LITGGVGTVGRELVRQVLLQRPRELRVIDNNESEVFFLEQEAERLLARHKIRDTRFCVYVGDVRDSDKLMTVVDGIDNVFHLAGLKHVIICERAPFDAVQTNILGVKNVINAALAHDVQRVLFTSSDKAVNPTNVMGTSKLMGERLITAANSLNGSKRTIFSSTRFGNVLGSRGSVVPIFQRQIRDGGPVTLTDRRMTRFVMTVVESCRLILSAAEIARGGEVFVTKMPVITIEDLAHVMADLLAPGFGYAPQSIDIRETGAKPGEKMYEELMSDEETRRAYELEEMFVVLPAFRSVYEEIDYDYPNILNRHVETPYASSPEMALNREQLRQFLEVNKILEDLDIPESERSEKATIDPTRRPLAA
jgi:FlaA1/EpsC-like NDP-sugar epimerase